MAERVGIGTSAEAFKCHLRDSADPWLLIFDNADDPSLNVAKYFPAGNRGSIIVTTRNPQCTTHGTVQSHEFGGLSPDDAILLLLRASDLPNSEATRKSAIPIAQTLGHLALAIVHAGALIRQGIYTLNDYCGIFRLGRKDLLNRRPAQATVGYEYTVYTTWEISVASIRESAKQKSSVTAENALDLLNLFGFFHFDNISEDIFKWVWQKIPKRTKGYPWTVSNQLRMLKEDREESWDPLPFREAVDLLATYSLVQINGNHTHISLHPLVHSWIRDSLDVKSKLVAWTTGMSTLFLACPDSMVINYETGQLLECHIRSCLANGDLNDFLVGDQFAIERAFHLNDFTANIYDSIRYPEDDLRVLESTVTYCKKVLGEVPWVICLISFQYALFLNRIGEHQKALDALESLPPWRDMVSDNTAIRIMSQFSISCAGLGRHDEALKWVHDGCERVKSFANQSEAGCLRAKMELSLTFMLIGQVKEAAGLLEGVVDYLKTTKSQEIVSPLYAISLLSALYDGMGRYQEALDLCKDLYETCLSEYGDTKNDTLLSAAHLGRQYGRADRVDDGIELLLRAIETGQRTGVRNSDLQEWKEWLDEMENMDNVEDMEDESGMAQQAMRKDKHRTRIKTWFKDRFKPKLLE